LNSCPSSTCDFRLGVRKKKLNDNPQWCIGNLGKVRMWKRFTTFVVVKNPALPNSKSVMSEAEFDLLLDAVKAAIAPAPQKDLLARPLSFNQPPEASNSNEVAWPFIPFPQGWYAS